MPRPHAVQSDCKLQCALCMKLASSRAQTVASMLQQMNMTFCAVWSCRKQQDMHWGCWRRKAEPCASCGGFQQLPLRQLHFKKTGC